MQIVDYLIVVCVMLVTRVAAWTSTGALERTVSAARIRGNGMRLRAEISSHAAPGHVITSPLNPYIKRIRCGLRCYVVHRTEQS